jgi:hypothetical protein
LLPPAVEVLIEVSVGEPDLLVEFSKTMCERGESRDDLREF